MKTLRYLVFVVFGVLLVLVVLSYWTLVFGPSESVAQAREQEGADARCNCNGLQKMQVPIDAEGRAVLDPAHLRTIAATQAAVEADIATRDKVERMKWVGCKFTASAKQGDQGFARQTSLIGLLSGKQPMPKQREAQYQWLSEYAGCRLVGWSITIANVTDGTDGEIIELLVRPRVARGDAPNTTVTYTCKETWKLDSSGNLVFQEIRPISGVMLLTGD